MAPDDSGIVINEFLAKSTKDVSDWIELYNRGASTIDISGYWLIDDLTKPLQKWFQVPAETVLRPGDFVVFNDDEDDLFGLSYGGEQIYLLKPDRRTLVDFHAFGAQIPEVSEGRWPDGGEQWVRFGISTPGVSNSLAVEGGHLKGKVVINEFLAANSQTNRNEFGEYADWIELYNTTEHRISLEGTFLTDDWDKPAQWKIPSGTEIPPKSFVLFWADDRDTTNHTNFKLKKSGEEIGLFDLDGITMIDSVRFGPQQEDVSFSRIPDGGEDWIFSSPTPGSSNSQGMRTGLIGF